MLKLLAGLGNLFWKVLGFYCPVHDCPLQLGENSVQFGLARKSPEYRKASKKLFPRAHDRLAGNYFLGAGAMAGKLARHGRYCPSCRSSEALWLEEHRIDWSRTLRMPD